MRALQPLGFSLAIIGAVWALQFTAVAHAADPQAKGYFVDCDGGNDGAAGTSYSTAWRT